VVHATVWRAPGSVVGANWVGIYVPRRVRVGCLRGPETAGCVAFGVGRGGYYAIEDIRSKGGYRESHRELTPSEKPVDAGAGAAVRVQAEDRYRILGRERSRRPRLKGRGRTQAFGSLVRGRTIQTQMLWGGELILREGGVADRYVRGVV